MENKPIQQRRNETIMPGYILHLTAAQMFLKTQKGQKFLKTKQDKNNFSDRKSSARYNKDQSKIPFQRSKISRSHDRIPGNKLVYQEI